MSTSESLASEVAALLREFGSRADPASASEAFADGFLVGDASGVRPVTREAFVAALPRRAESFARAGVVSTTLDHLEVEPLDARYVLARARWTASRAADADLTLESSFVLYRDAGSLRVVMYLNHRGL